MKTKTRDIPYATAILVAERIKRRLEASRLVGSVHIAGSLRRHEPFVSDIDILIVTKHIETVRERISYDDNLRDGERNSPHQVDGIQVDLCFVSPEHHASALLYFTGPKELNIRMRAKAKKLGWKLSRYGLSGGSVLNLIALPHTEADIFEALGMEFVKPVDR